MFQFPLLLICTSLVAAAQFNNEFVSFKQTFNKNYDEKEEAYRTNVFESNLKIINEHNKGYKEGKYTWTMGINQFTDLTAAEFGALNNLQVPNAPQREVTYQMKSYKVASAVDWRKKNIVTEVKDQKQCGSCWAFGAVASIEAAHAEKYGELISMSEQQLVDCVQGTDCYTGGNYAHGWDYVQEAGGIESEDNYPYEGHKFDCRFDKDKTVSQVTNFTQWVRDGNEENLVRKLNDHPQAVAIDASNLQHYTGGIVHNTPYNHCSNVDPDHAVFVVGYDSEDGKDYYIVKNSWGKNWGEDGYFRIARGEDNVCGIANYPAHAAA